MQSRPLTARQALVSNALWFIGSLVLAFLVWMTANAQRDPIEERRLTERSQIQFLLPQNMLLTNISSDSVALRLRGQRSQLALLTTDDITVTADLEGLAPGTYPITLTANAQRERITVDTIPRQVTVTLELLESRLVPVEAMIAGELPPGYESDAPQFDVREVTVSGAASQVSLVDAAMIRLDVTDQRTTLSNAAQLVAVDANGAVVGGVTLNPQVINVSMPIRQRPDVREVSVQPNLVGVDSLPAGYLFTSLSYEPRSVLVSGSVELLNSLPETFFTTPIDLTSRTANFEETVTVQLPSRDLVILSGQTINVSIGITTQTATRQFDNVEVEIIGLEDGLRVTTTPAEVSLLITGAQPVLDELNRRDVRVILDLNGLEAGGYQLTPQPTLAQVLPEGVTISVLPASIDVQIMTIDSG
jgi:YbbR domain-containing protein